MHGKRQRDDHDDIEGLEVNIKIRKTRIDNSHIQNQHSENTHSEKTHSENTCSETTLNASIHSENTHSKSTHGANTNSKNTQSENIHSEKIINVNAHKKNDNNTNTYGENTHNENTFSENTHNVNTSKEYNHSGTSYSKNTFSEKTHSVKNHSEKIDTKKIVKEKVESEKNRCAVCNGDDHEDPQSCKEWSYPSTNWPEICPDYCNGNSQSPINIVSADVIKQTPRAEFIYTDYNKRIPNVNINNNGHSVTVSWEPSEASPRISDGGLEGDYTLAQFHFHWGAENDQGSEHTIDGHSFAMELHLVHYKSTYGSLGEAIKHSDGLAVFGVLFDVGAEDPTLKPITNKLSLITEPGEDEDIVFNMNLEDLVPESPFFRYNGSLTTPTCNEVVIWTVFTQVASVNQDQIDAFRSLKDHHGASLCNNYRAVQPLNGRTVYEYNSN